MKANFLIVHLINLFNESLKVTKLLALKEILKSYSCLKLNSLFVSLYQISMNARMMYTTAMLMASVPIQTDHFIAHATSHTLVMESTAQVKKEI